MAPLSKTPTHCSFRLAADRITLPLPLLTYSLQNKSQIGKVDEILGPINELYFTVKMDPGMQASSFKANDKVYIGGDKLLPIERFLPKPKVVQKGACWAKLLLCFCGVGRFSGRIDGPD